MTGWPRVLSSLRARLLLMVLLATIPALGFLLFVTTEHQQLAVAAQRTELRRLARRAAAQHREVIDSGRSLVRTLADSGEIHSTDPARCRARLRNVMQQAPRYRNLTVARPDGIIWCSAEPMPAAPPVAVSDRPYFRRAVETGEFAVGDYGVSRITGKPRLVFGQPVLGSDGRIRGVLAAGLDLGWLSDFAADVDLPAGTTVTLVDSAGTVLAREPDPERWVGRSLKAGLASVGPTDLVGTVDASDLDGTARLFGFAVLTKDHPDGGLYVMIGFPRDLVTAEARRILGRNLAVLGLAALFALAVAWVGGDALVLRRVRRLMGVVRRVGAGDLAARTGASGRGDELDALALAFDHTVEALQAGEAQLRLETSALAAAANGIVITDREGSVVWANPAFTTLTGYAAEEAVGQTLRLLRSGAQEPAFYRELWATILAGQVWQGTLVNRRKDGSLYHEEMTITPVRGNGGAITHFIAVKQDVSARVAAEAQLRQAQKVEAIGQLAGGIAHDFNNLLTVILGRSQLLEQQVPAEGPGRRNVELIRRTAERAAALTGQLLAFSRRQVLAPRVVDLTEVVQGMAQMLQRLIGEDIELAIAPGAGLWPVQADPHQLEQVVMNLAINARDAMPQGGRLRVETANVELDEAFAQAHPGAAAGPQVCLTVSDTGVGMDEATRLRVFEPFFTTKEVGKGTGLGLSTVYGIVKQHGGYIEIESAPGRGATFRVYLPRSEAPADGRAPGAAGAGTPGGTETILLVEDDAEVREIAREILAAAGYTVLEAGHPAEAAGVLAGHPGPIHLLLSDVVMPGMSGPQLAAQLTAERPGLRVLFISGYTADALEPRGALAPGTALLHKPFTPEALARGVREVLDRG